MYAINFEYANERLSDYGMMICTFNGSGGTEAVSSGADITFSQAKASGSSRFSLYSFAYENAYTATFQICRLPCSSKAGKALYLMPDEVTAIQRWLCRKEYHRFKIDQDGYRNIYWNAVFQSKQIMRNGQIAGLEVTLFTDAPYAYHDPVTLTFDSPQETIIIYDSSDETGYIYPSIKIECLSDGSDDQKTFTLSNSFDNKVMRISNCIQGEIITIDGRSLTITSSKSHPTLAADFNYFFPKIQNTYLDNKNIFTANTNCKITFTYSPIRKIGL